MSKGDAKMINQKQIWDTEHGYKGTSRKWAARRSKRALKKILGAGVNPSDLIPVAKQAYRG